MIKNIKKRTGKIEEFNENKIKNAILKAMRSVNKENKELLEKLFKDIKYTLETRFEKEIPTIENIQNIVENTLMKDGLLDIAKSYILYREKHKELREKKEKILSGKKDDIKLSINSLTVLERRYLLKDKNGKIIETPTQLFRRVARNIAQADKIYDKNANLELIENKFFKMMSELKFLPNSPCLMNAGADLQQLSGCFVLPVGDSMEEIFQSIKDAALIHKSGGGTGFSFSRLRPKNSFVKTTNGVSSGPVSFMRAFNACTEVVKQGGKRRGANMAVLRVDHPDILEFITCKEEEGNLNNFNISVGVTDVFMKAVENGEYYNLVDPHTKKIVSSIDARQVFDLIVIMAWRNGEPGIVFLDKINEKNPTPNVGIIESTNPCVTKDTWVLTDKGPHQVDELIGKNFKVIVNGKSYKVLSNGFFKTDTRQTLEFITKEGFKIKLTDNHKIMKINNKSKKWVEARELKINDKILLHNHTSFEWTGNGTKKEGYILGLLFGDGTIKKDKIILSVKGNKKEIKNYILNLVANNKKRSDFKGWMYIKDKDEYRLSLAIFKKILEKYEIKKKVINKKLETTCSIFYKAFLSGIFDANGSIQGNIKKRVSIRLSQSNLTFLETVQRMLLRLGIFSKIYKRRKAGLSLLPNGKNSKQEYKTKTQYELIISNNSISIFYKKINFVDGTKKNKLKKLLTSYKRLLNKDKFYATIKFINKRKIEDVYDVTVSDINAFDANGFYCHNCGEQPLLPYESCNLGSINVAKFANKNKEGNYFVNWNSLKEIIHTTVHFMDNVIDMNRYPLEEIDKVTKANRKIGLGIMGFADLLFKLKIPYNSQEGVDFAEKLMKFIRDEGRTKSIELGRLRGIFPNYKLSVLQKENRPQRNATITTIAPTGTISMIANASSGCEPLFALAYTKHVMDDDDLVYGHEYFEEILKEKNIYSPEIMKRISEEGSIQHIEIIPKDIKKIFVTAHDISPEWHIKMQASFQKYIDSAVSKTVNFPNSATPEDVSKVYKLAYKLNCKGVTIYRDKSRSSQVLNLHSKDGNILNKNLTKAYLDSVKSSIKTQAYINDFNNKKEDSKIFCPVCKTKLEFKEGCASCPNCGFSYCNG